MLKLGFVFILIIAAVCFCRGYRILDRHEKFARTLKSDNSIVHVIENIQYHGGFPPMPKLQHLNVGLSYEKIILYNQNEDWGTIGWGSVQDIEKFTIGKKSSSGPYDYSLWASLLPMLGPLMKKDKGRYFIAINYIDCDQDDNHVLLECADVSQQSEIAGALNGFRENNKVVPI